MPQPDFHGRDALLATIDAAIAENDVPRIVARLSRDLASLLHDGALQLPAQVFTPVAGHYARRLLHHSAERGYSVIAMTWAPGQITPLHDHDGQWCVEGIIQGALEIAGFDWLESDGELHRFAAGARELARIGNTSGLYAPRKYHVVRNPSADITTVSLHVYERRMDRCHVFEPLPERPGWYRRTLRELAAD